MSVSGVVPRADIPSNNTPIFMLAPLRLVLPRGGECEASDRRNVSSRPAQNLSSGRRSSCASAAFRFAQRDILPRGGKSQARLNQLVVTHPRRAGCFWKAGIVRGIREYSG